MSKDMIKCPSCGELNFPADECLFCGSSLTAEKEMPKETSDQIENDVVCPNCFSMNPVGAMSCSSCGMGLESSDEAEDDGDLSFDLPSAPSLAETKSFVTEDDASAAMPALPDFDFLAPSDISIESDLAIDDGIETKPSFMTTIGLYGTLIWSLVFTLFIVLTTLGSIGFENPNISLRGGMVGLEDGFSVDPIGLIYSIMFFIIFGWHTRYRWESTNKSVSFPIFSLLTLFLVEGITLLILLLPLPFIASSSELLYIFLVMAAFWSVFTLFTLGIIMYVFSSSVMYKPILNGISQ